MIAEGAIPRRVIVAISGASGVIYGIRLLKHLKRTNLETHLVISEAGRKNIYIETDRSPEEIEKLADKIYDHHDVGAAIASGSFLTEGMVIAPCTIKTLSGIVNSYNDNLIVRAADVTLKEKRKLILMVRETPLHKGHLRLMRDAADNGADILPPMPAFYHKPKTIEDIIDQTIGKTFDLLGIEHELFQRWGE